ncbi:Uncharacterised protein [Chromobacterium violaceum]|uniref:Uncharacterized protein n=1 Tax=Chromobacterium violaceum TaxID=536 RepID=A0A3S4I9K8_CHRVL|nr:Uncharacterised protein [Chromobacterium violaceum]
MTIIVNTPAANAGTQASPGSAASAGNSGSGAAGDLFASLLGIQMSTMGAMLPELGDGGNGKSSDDKPAAKDGQGDGALQAALAMPMLTALQLQPQQAEAKAPVQDLLAQQTTAKVDPSLLLQTAKQGFNWQDGQQKLPDPETTAAQFLPLQQLQQAQPQQAAHVQSNAGLPS